MRKRTLVLDLFYTLRRDRLQQLRGCFAGELEPLTGQLVDIFIFFGGYSGHSVPLTFQSAFPVAGITVEKTVDINIIP